MHSAEYFYTYYFTYYEGGYGGGPMFKSGDPFALGGYCEDVHEGAEVKSPLA